MVENLTPTAKTERIEVLDALRGFALFGILLANITDWSGWGWLDDQERMALAEGVFVRLTDFLNLMLINGKFYTIFSFLFGIGFALQLSRLERRGKNGISIYRRRLLLLLLIGFVHMTFIWNGDILVLYAALGLLLPLVYQWEDRRLVLVATVLILLPIAGYTLVAATGVSPNFGLYDAGNKLSIALFVAFNGSQPPADMQWAQLDDWGAYWSWSLSGPPFRIGNLLQTWRIPKVLGVMMLGVWAGRRLIDGRLLEDRRLLKRVAVIGFAVGLPANAAYAWMGGLWQEGFSAGLKATVLYAVGVVPLGLAYAASFALLWRFEWKVLTVLQAPGRMALSNYLTHSILGIAVFYGIGLGLIGHSPPSMFYSLAVAIFLSQILLSRAWLNHFRQGPMEWLWRLGTYRGLKQ